jgi:RNA polymerase sigma-70 factor (ECF subfamily)
MAAHVTSEAIRIIRLIVFSFRALMTDSGDWGHAVELMSPKAQNGHQRPDGRCMNPSDQTLLGHAQAGDADAFEQLLQRYTRMLASYVRQWLPASLQRKVSVADVLQETRIVAFERVATFELHDERSIRNWLIKIVELTVREKVRRFAGTAKRAAGREVTRGRRPDTAQFHGRGPSPSEAAIASELAMLAQRALHGLPPDYQEILQLMREEDLTLREAGASMGRSREAAKKLYARALSAFTERFEQLQGVSRG